MTNDRQNDPISTFYSVVGQQSDNGLVGSVRPAAATSADVLAGLDGEGLLILRVLAEKEQPYSVVRLTRDLQLGLFRVVDRLRRLESSGLVRLRSGREDTAELGPNVREIIASW